MTLIKECAGLAAYPGGMWPYHPQLLDRPVPRYTSYPPATAFTPEVGAREQAAALSGLARGTQCRSMSTSPIAVPFAGIADATPALPVRRNAFPPIRDALDREIALVAALVGGRARVERIAFGGGSPNAIEPLAFARLVDRLTTLFGTAAPLLSVEIDPRGFTAEWARTLALAGASRASLGVQSFDPAIQAAIGRIQPPDLIARCVSDLRHHGLESVNFDLMYGLPGQGESELRATLQTAMDMKPDRIALLAMRICRHVPTPAPHRCFPPS